MWVMSGYCHTSWLYLTEEINLLSTGRSLSLLQKLLVGFCVVGIPYMRERSTEIRRITDKVLDFNFIWKCIYAGEKVLHVLSVLNFLVFLQRGKYPSILERILGIHPVFAERQSIRQVSFEFMTRELLWHGFAEFVFFLLPLINVPKLKNMIVRQFSRPVSLDKQPSIKVACHECGICNEPPTSPHQGQCGHVFCYYCIKANSLADSSFPCPLCGVAVGDDITPVECTVALEVTWTFPQQSDRHEDLISIRYRRHDSILGIQCISSPALVQASW